MVPSPVPLALLLCEDALVEEGTRRVTFLRMLTKLTGGSFPFVLRFFAFATLTGGLGDAKVELVISNLDDLADLYSQE